MGQSTLNFNISPIITIPTISWFLIYYPYLYFIHSCNNLCTLLYSIIHISWNFSSTYTQQLKQVIYSHESKMKKICKVESFTFFLPSTKFLTNFPSPTRELILLIQSNSWQALHGEPPVFVNKVLFNIVGLVFLSPVAAFLLQRQR